MVYPVSAQITVDSTVTVYAWKLANFYQDRVQIKVDTVLDDFQIYDPVFQQFTSPSTLGSYGLPAQSIVFTERMPQQQIFPISAYKAFMSTYGSTQYFNTRKPYSQLRYINGGSYQSKQEIFEALHSQNLTPTLNVGFKYTTAGDLGSYKFQKAKRNSFSFFSNHTGEIYSYHLSINWNKLVADENGGVADDSQVTDTTYENTKDIPTLFGGTERGTRHFPDVENQIRNFNIFTVQELSIKKKKANEDTDSLSKKIRIFYPKLFYITGFEQTRRNFTDKNPLVGYNDGLYNNLFISDERTSDSLVYRNWHNTLRLQFQGRSNNHYFIDYSYDLMNYSLLTGLADSTISALYPYWSIANEIQFPGLTTRAKYHNSYVSSGFSRVFANLLQLDLFGRLYLSGYNAGDFTLAGEVKLDMGGLKNPVQFTAGIDNELRTPDYLLVNYISNNYIWSRNLRPTLTNHLSTNLSFSSKKFDIKADYYLFHNVIFFNYDALPEQYGNNLSVLTVSISKKLDFWKISSTTRLVYQKSENEKVIGLPEIVFFNSIYLKHRNIHHHMQF